MGRLYTLAAAFAGLSLLRVQDSWIDGFAPGSGFRAAMERANRLFHGTHLLLAVGEAMLSQARDSALLGASPRSEITQRTGSPATLSARCPLAGRLQVSPRQYWSTPAASAGPTWWC